MDLSAWHVTRRTAASGDDSLDGFDLNFDSIREVHTHLASMISSEGIFIPTENLPDHSAVVRFRVMLPDDFALIEGTGVVFWLRAPGEDAALPVGAAVRYVTLGDRSRELIDKIVETHRRAGGAVFNVDTKDGQPPVGAYGQGGAKAAGAPVSAAPGAGKPAPAAAKTVMLGMKKPDPQRPPVQLRLQVRGDEPPPRAPQHAGRGGAEEADDPNATVWAPPARPAAPARPVAPAGAVPKPAASQDVGRAPSAGGPAAPQLQPRPGERPVRTPEPTSAAPERAATPPTPPLPAPPVAAAALLDDAPLELELEIDLSAPGPSLESEELLAPVELPLAADLAPAPPSFASFQPGPDEASPMVELLEVDDSIEDVAAASPAAGPAYGDDSGLDWDSGDGQAATTGGSVVGAADEAAAAPTDDWQAPPLAPEAFLAAAAPDSGFGWEGPEPDLGEVAAHPGDALIDASDEDGDGGFAGPEVGGHAGSEGNAAERPDFWVEDEREVVAEPLATPLGVAQRAGGAVEQEAVSGRDDEDGLLHEEAEELDLAMAFSHVEEARPQPLRPTPDEPAKEEFGRGFEFTLHPDQAAAGPSEVVAPIAPPKSPKRSSVRPPRRGGSGLVKVLAASCAVLAVAAAGFFAWDWYQHNVASLDDGEEAVEVAQGSDATVVPDSAGEMAAAGDSAAVVAVAEPETDATLGGEPQLVAETPLTAAEPTPLPTAVPTAAPTPSAVAPSGPARAVEQVVFRSVAGGTEVTITGDGSFAAKDVSVTPMDDPPRVLVRLRRIERGYRDEELAVGSAEVAKIRIGHHPEQSPPALYVVLDLSAPGVRVGAPVVDGATITVTATGG